MSGCADWAASAALPIAPVPWPANGIPPRSQSRTRNLRPPPSSAIQRSPAFLSGRSLEPARTDPGAPCGLVSGVVEPPQGLQICEVPFVTTRPSPGTQRLATPINRGYPVGPRQQDREYRDRTLIYRESGNRPGAWSARETLAPSADGESPTHPLNRSWFRDSTAVSRRRPEYDRGSGPPLKPETE